MKTLAIVFGGKSAEHEVSVKSARNIFDAIDRNKYSIVLIGISRSGRWQLVDEDYLRTHDQVINDRSAVALLPAGQGQLIGGIDSLPKIDVFFPILHGPFGEDGTIQGIFRAAEVPYVGAGVLGSAIGMDKSIMKQVLRSNGLPVGDFIVLKTGNDLDYKKIVDDLGEPFFVKPANLGSSVGISKVQGQREYEQALALAGQHDRKIILEKMIRGRELECAVLGNDNPQTSGVGEIIPKEDFYTYSAKYLNEDGAALVVPADLNETEIAEIKRLSLATFRALDCTGLARVDFFLSQNGDLFINEINTLPGFTSISMYPKLWEEEGTSYGTLIDNLVNLAIESFQQERQLSTAKF